MKLLPNPHKWAVVLADACVVAGVIYLLVTGKVTDALQLVGVVAVLLAMAAYTALKLRLLSKRQAMESADPGVQEEPATSSAPIPTRRNKALVAQFFLGASLLAVLLGLLVPSALISSSPTEFVNANVYVDPLSHVVHTTCVWFGLLVLWLGVYFLLSDENGRGKMALIIWCLCAIALVGYFVFKSEFGTITAILTYDGNVQWEWVDIFINLGVLVVAIVAVIVVWKKANRVVAPVLGVLTISLVALSVPNIVQTRSAVDAYLSTTHVDMNLFDNNSDPKKILPLSRTGNNVVVLFLDRALSGTFPYILDERPELAQKLDGFVYYPNTASFGLLTNFGAPPLYGGYEYTPTKMNEREDESLENKHDEALLVMPTLFSQAGYKTVIADPPYAKYQWISDLSLFDGLDNTAAYNLTGAYTQLVDKEYDIPTTASNRNFVFFGLFRVAPRLLQIPLYDDGTYCQPTGTTPPSQLFMDSWSTLHMLPSISTTEEEGNNFLLLGNCATHDPDYLALPDYEPSPHTRRETPVPGVFVHDGKTMDVSHTLQYKHYQTNASALLQLTRWFDWMREQGVYDNTRIIVVSDHGRDLKLFQGQSVDDILDVEMVNPLFMVKDFNAHGFTTSDEFMTNADTPTLAMGELLEDPANPYTGNRINSDEKTEHEQVVTASENWDIRTNNGNVFDTSDRPWYAVHDNIFDLNNWRRLDSEALY